ncbi:polymorphic toxin type 22 domain-containing protein [Massilia aquatica]|uniref:polymorphic toxin type 22 domain-containing protein n=1 Tax=Massilia aquatica TaxID=2609000 RepID=UPI00165297E2|nr:polymorphic toxin type 22 domain-containing protein [Massilia aquatica]
MGDPIGHTKPGDGPKGGGGGDKTGKIIGPCSGNVFTNGIKAARASVDETVCSKHDSAPPPIATGSPTVFINGLPAARVSDKIACGAYITEGSPNVFIGSNGAKAEAEMAKNQTSPALQQALLMAEAGADALQSSAAQKDASGLLGNDTRPTIASLSDAGAKLFAQAYQLNRASELAYASGHKASGAAYREAASNASAASEIYFRSAAKMSDDAERIAQAARSNPFGPGWNYMGAKSAGFDHPSPIRPNYYTGGVGSLSGAASVTVNTYDGTVYKAAGVVLSTESNTSVKPSLSATAGWIFGANDADSTNSFLAGSGNQVFLSVPTPWRVNAIVAVSHAYGGAYALELGVGSPGKLAYGASPFTYSAPLIKPKDKE